MRDIGPVGVWSWTLDGVPLPEVVGHAQLIEELGYSALWFKEDFGREALTTAAVLLANTETLVVANGVASIHGRDAHAMRSAQRGLAEVYPARHVLAVGVSHSAHVATRGGGYGPPAATARAYLTAMRDAEFISPAPAAEMTTLLAALGPRMQEVAGRYADGVHSFGVTVEHTRRTREALGDGGTVVPVQPVVLDDNASRARDTARAYVTALAGLPNYVAAWKRLGFGDGDIDGGVSDRLVEAVVVTGGEDAAATRVLEQFDAGADHVAVQIVPTDLQTPPVDGWRRFAPVAREIAAARVAATDQVGRQRLA